MKVAMLSVAEAEALISELVHELIVSHHDIRTESVLLGNALGRVLAEPISSSLDFPHWDNSAMDGYAVRAEDVSTASPEHPICLPLAMEVAAGQVPARTLQAGEAARIFTGAMLPEGADAIVMQENTITQRSQHSDEAALASTATASPTIEILQAVEPGQFVRRQGSFHRAGDRLLEPGLRLGAPEIAVLAAAQIGTLSVVPQVQVGLLSTGNELVDVDQPLGAGQIVDSNAYALGAAVTRAGAIAQSLGRLPDDRAALERAIAAAQSNNSLDIVLSTGGVSVGDYDYVDDILENLGAKLHIRSVAVKPGKPLTVATLPRPTQHSNQGSEAPPLIYFGLPGNPVSALVSFWRFVQPALQQLSGLKQWQPQFISATAQTELRSGGSRETYLWGNLHWVGTGFEFSPAGGGHSSGNLVNLAGTNGLAKLPVGVKQVKAGDRLQVLLPYGL